jgi:hypothetical protein
LEGRLFPRATTPEEIEPLQLQDCAQPLIDGALQTSRQRACMLRQKTAVESQELRDVHHRVSGKASGARRQQDIPGGVSQFDVAGDRCYDRGLNSAAIECVCLDNKHRTPISGLRAARFGEICPPDVPSPNLSPIYQASFSIDFNWARCNPESTLAVRRE